MVSDIEADIETVWEWLPHRLDDPMAFEAHEAFERIIAVLQGES